VKRIKPEMLSSAKNAEDVRLFVQEAQLLRKMDHPSVVRTGGIGRRAWLVIAGDLRDTCDRRIEE
jgi:hypothetical protein